MEFFRKNWLLLLLCALSYLAGVATARTAALFIKLIIGAVIVGVVIIVAKMLQKFKEKKDAEV